MFARIYKHLLLKVKKVQICGKKLISVVFLSIYFNIRYLVFMHKKIQTVSVQLEHLFIYLFIYLFIHLFIYLFNIYLLIYSLIYLFIYSFIYLFI